MLHGHALQFIVPLFRDDALEALPWLTAKTTPPHYTRSSLLPMDNSQGVHGQAHSPVFVLEALPNIFLLLAELPGLVETLVVDCIS